MKKNNKRLSKSNEIEILKLVYQELKEEYYSISTEFNNINAKKNILALIVSLIMQLFFNLFIPRESLSSLYIFTLFVLNLLFLVLILLPIKFRNIDTSNIYNEIYTEHNQDEVSFLRSSIATYQQVNRANRDKASKCHELISAMSVAYALLHVIYYVIIY
jgi:hypothetical protein